MQKKEKQFLIDILLLNVFIVMVFFGNNHFGTADLGIYFKWYIVLVLATIVGWPITSIIFDKFDDKGYIFAKLIGLVLPSIVVFFLCNFRLMKFTYINTSIIFLIFLLASITYLVVKQVKFKKKSNSQILETLEKGYRIEVIFFVILTLITYVRGFSPSVADIEKFMDYGFMNSMMHYDYLPAPDMWLSGNVINYYYYGHFFAVFITRVANISIDYGYNFMLVSIFAMTFFMSYSIINNALKLYFKEKSIEGKKSKILPVIGGSLAALANTVSGNGHFLVFKYIVPFFDKITNHTSKYIYAWTDSTRYIGEYPPSADKTITEFPSYSFLVGDVHAHLSDIIIVLSAIAIILAFIIKYKKDRTDVKKTSFSIKDTFNIYTIMLGILIGIMKMTNYWDFPIYSVVCLITFLTINILNYKNIKDVIWCTILQTLIIFTLASIVSLPFVLQFIKISSKIKISKYHTMLYQLLILWGIPFFISIVYVINSIREQLKKKPKKRKNAKKEIWYKKAGKAIYTYMDNLTVADFFIIILIICAFGLIIAPELVYVVDIYDNAPRANTMFKLTYNSFIMLGLCMSYMLLKLIIEKGKFYKIFGSIFLFIFIATFLYSIDPLLGWYGNVFNSKEYEGLDSTEFLNNYYMANYMDEDKAKYVDSDITMVDDLAVINWLKENANRGDVILEHQGDDFSFDNRVSVFTALPTPLGWVAHEWLWRSVNSSIDFPDSLQERSDDIDYIYTSGDIEKNKELLAKYNIKYIIVGYVERLHLSPETLEIPYEDSLKSLGEVVFETNNNNSGYPTYIIKIND